MFYMYILWSSSLCKSYVGSTEDMQERLRRHNAGHCQATKAGRPWIVAHQENFSTRSAAMARERYWKTGRGREERDRILARMV